MGRGSEATITRLGQEAGPVQGTCPQNPSFASFLIGLVEIHVSAACMSQPPCGSLVNKLFKELKRGEINEAAIDPTSAAD